MAQQQSTTTASLSGPSIMSLEQRIQRWVQLDNHIKQINDEVRELRDSRNEVESSILTHVTDHNLSHATVRIKDGTLKFAFNVKQPPAITLSFLGEALTRVLSTAAGRRHHAAHSCQTRCRRKTGVRNTTHGNLMFP